MKIYKNKPCDIKYLLKIESFFFFELSKLQPVNNRNLLHDLHISKKL